MKTIAPLMQSSFVACALSAVTFGVALRPDAGTMRFGTTAAQPAAAPPAVEPPVGVRHGLRFERGIIDTSRQPVLQASALPKTTRGTVIVLVQYARPLDAAGRKALAAVGATIHGYVPENGYLIELPAARAADAQRLPGVRWAGGLQPMFKISRRLAEQRARIAWHAERAQHTNNFLAGKELPQGKAPQPPPTVDEYLPLTINLFNADDADGVVAQLKGLGAKDVGAAVYEGALGRSARIRARVHHLALDAVAALPEVQWIEEFKQPELFNSVAVQPHLMNVTPVWETNWLGLTGRGQIVAHADTGLDTGNLLTLHPDFTNRLRAVFGLWRTGGAWSDPNGHGTHTAGSLVGNGSALSNGLFKAPAYEAQLVHQSLYYDATYPLVTPTNLQELFQQTYATNARIQSCSWGSTLGGVYDSYARDVDAFMWSHPDMLIVFAAGNQGYDGNGDGVVDLGSMTSPASAKNTLTVGAAESDRPAGSGGYSSYPYGTGGYEPLFPVNPIHDDLFSTSADGLHQGMFAMSSRGPCTDGRIKPDIVAPGTDIISCRSRLSGASTFWGVYNNNYVFAGGTSMATPLTASAAALVRQYFAEKHSTIISNPSAALVKAVLLNGARSLTPGQYGYEQYREIPLPPRPNVVEGWGHVNLAASLSNITVWDMQPLTSDTTNIYELVVPGTNAVSVLLAWTDYPGTLGAAQALVNDLDLQLIMPDGTVQYPNGLNGPDHTNNVEGIDVAFVPPGVCTVQVSGVVNMGVTQHYALVVRGAAWQPAAFLIESINYDPKVVRPVHTPTVSAVVKTNASGLAAVTLFYRINAGAWLSKPMAVRTAFESGAVYTNTIPAQAMGSTAEFYVVAVANDGTVLTNGPRSYTVGEYAVFVWRGGSQTWPCDTWATAFSNIYQAMAHSNVTHGYTIYVTNGVYSARDSGVGDGIIVNKAVHLIGVNGARHTIIDGAYNGRVLTMINPGAVVEGFTIQRGYAQGVIEGGGVYMNAGTLRRCVVRDNYLYHVTSQGGGIWLDNGLVDACIIRDNHSWGNWEANAGGVCARQKGVVRNSVCVKNESLSGWYGYGGNIALMVGGAVSNCTAAGGTASGQLGGGGGGIYINFTGTVHNSISYHNSNGNHYHYSNANNLQARWSYSCTTPTPSGSGITVVSNITSDPLFVNHTGYDCHLRPASPCRNAGQWQTWMTNAIDADGFPRVNEGAVDMGGLEFGPFSASFTATPKNGYAPLRVFFTSYINGANTNNAYFHWDFNADGSNELEGTQWARPTNVYSEGYYLVTLTASNELGETYVWDIDSGIYAYNTNIHYAAFGGAHVWPFTSMANAATNLFEALNACISGHTLVLSDGVYRLGGTIEVPSGVTVRGFNGRDRTVLDGMGAVRPLYLYSGSVAEGLTISNGYYGYGGVGGGGVYFNGGGILRNARLIKNGSTLGGGAYLSYGGTLEDCIIQNNSASMYGGGVRFERGGTVNRCVFIGNSASQYGGAAEFYYAGGVMRNSLIAHNTAVQYGGAIFLGNQGGGTLENCTIVSNVCSTANQGGGVYGWSSTLTMRNCIVFFNRAGSAANNIKLDNVTATLQNLCTTPAMGTQCLSNDPRFVNFAARDYRLRGDSYCINAGQSLSWMSGATDVEGNARIINGAPDIGAYELNTNAPLLRVQATLSDPNPLGTLEFGTNWVDTTYNKTLAIRNVGGSALTGTVAVAAGVFSCVSATNYVLGINGNSTLTFSFSPLSNITYTATATFSGGSGASVLLRGTGAIPEPAWAGVLLLLAAARRPRAC